MSHKDRVELEKVLPQLPDCVTACGNCAGAGVIGRLHITCPPCMGRGSVPWISLKLTDRERMELENNATAAK